jgi:hypothetical protein
MTMPVEKIIQMLVILKIAEESKDGKYAKKVEDYGLEFDPRTGKLTGSRDMVPAIDRFGGQLVTPIRDRTVLPDWFTAAEEKVYRQVGINTGALKKVCPPRKPFRCNLDSAAPGICSPSRKLCYAPKLREKYAAPTGKAAEVRKQIKNLSRVADVDGTLMYGPWFDAVIDNLEHGYYPLTAKDADYMAAEHTVSDKAADYGELRFKSNITGSKSKRADYAKSKGYGATHAPIYY